MEAFSSLAEELLSEGSLEKKERKTDARENLKSNERKGSPHKTVSWVLNRNLAGQREWREVSKVTKSRDYSLDHSAQQSCQLEWKGR